MAHLQINGQDYEGKTQFKFLMTADEKYAEKNEQGQTIQKGLQVIYTSLLDFDPLALVNFWDCALSHLKKKPTKDDIQEALLEAAQDDDDYNFEPLFQEAFQAIDNAGFFRKQVNNIWSEQEKMKAFLKDDQEKQAYEMQVKEMKENRMQLNPSISTK